jgi:hypothetical protein
MSHCSLLSVIAQVPSTFHQLSLVTYNALALARTHHITAVFPAIDTDVPAIDGQPPPDTASPSDPAMLHWA